MCTHPPLWRGCRRGGPARASVLLSVRRSRRCLVHGVWQRLLLPLLPPPLWHRPIPNFKARELTVPNQDSGPRPPYHRAWWVTGTGQRVDAVVLGLPGAPAWLPWATLWRVGFSGPGGRGHGPCDGMGQCSASVPEERDFSQLGSPPTGPPLYLLGPTREFFVPCLPSFPWPPLSEVRATATSAPQVRKPRPRLTATSLVQAELFLGMRADGPQVPVSGGPRMASLAHGRAGFSLGWRGVVTDNSLPIVRF